MSGRNKSKILLLFLLTFPVSNYYSQEIKNHQLLHEFLIPVLNQDYLGIKEKKSHYYLNKFQNSTPSNINGDRVIIDSIMINTASNLRSKQTYIYDESGKISSFTLYYLINNILVNGKQEINQYDSLGNTSSILHKWWTGYQWENDFLENFLYDEVGNNILHLSKTWVVNKWENTLRITKTYDEDVNILTSITEHWNDSMWINSTRLTFNYLTDGIKKSQLIEVWNGSYWGNEMFQTFKYDDKLKLILVYSEIWNGNNWQNYIQVSINYSLNPPQTTGLIELWESEKWTNYGRYFYWFNKENYFTHGLFEAWNYSSWVPANGGIFIENPDGFIEHLLANEVFVYYSAVSSVNDEKSSAEGYELSQNYPNPFNPITTIKYSISNPGYVTLKVYDILGKEVTTLVNEEKQAGIYKVEFDASNLASGIYIYTLTADNYSDSKKLILLK